MKVSTVELMRRVLAKAPPEPCRLCGKDAGGKLVHEGCRPAWRRQNAARLT